MILSINIGFNDDETKNNPLQIKIKVGSGVITLRKNTPHHNLVFSMSGKHWSICVAACANLVIG